MGDKQFRGENSGGARHKVKFWTVFRRVFIGFIIVILLLIILIGINYNRGIKETLIKGLEEAKIKKEVIEKEVFKILEENNQVILKKALEKSLPQIQELKNKNLAEVKSYIDQKLDVYFQERIISSGKVERFLDELYSVKNNKEVDEKDIEELFYNTVLSPQDLSNYVNEKIVPYLENKYSEFRKESIKVVKSQYVEEAKRILGEKYENPEKFQSVIEEYFRDSIEKTILEKIDSIGFVLKEDSLVEKIAGVLPGFIGYIIYKFIIRDRLRTEILNALNELKIELGNSIFENYKKQIETFLTKELVMEIKLKDLGK